MTLQIIVDGRTESLDQLNGYLTNFDDNARRIYYAVAVEVFAELRALILEAIQFYPPVPAGSRYIRTFRLRRGWQVDLHLFANTVELVISNATPYTAKVVGTLINNDALARATQEAFHANNGWPVALDTARFWFDRFKDAFIEAFVDAIIADVKAKV
jgi:hypothetical protein